MQCANEELLQEEITLPQDQIGLKSKVSWFKEDLPQFNCLQYVARTFSLNVP